MPVSPLPPYFLDTSFIVRWFICWSFSVVYFKNGPEYLTRRTAHVFIHLMRFLQCSVVLRSFLVLLVYSFLFFFYFISACLIVSISNIPKYLLLFFLWIFWFSIHFIVPFLLPFVVFGFSLLTWHIFLCCIRSICPDCISSVSELSFPILFHIGLISAMYIRWLIFPWDFLSLYLPVHFLSI